LQQVISDVLLWLRITRIGRTLVRMLLLASGAVLAVMLNVIASATYANTWNNNDNLLVIAAVVLQRHGGQPRTAADPY
jgi:hypothetical protein